MYGKQDFADLVTSRKALSSTIMNREYESLKSEVRSKIKGQQLAFTTDIKTDDYTQRNFISLTAHYVDESFKLQVALPGIKEFTDDKKTGENILNNVKEILVEYSLDSNIDKCIFVTDNGANVVAAFKSYKRLSCACHKVNLNSLMECCKNLVK